MCFFRSSKTLIAVPTYNGVWRGCHARANADDLFYGVHVGGCTRSKKDRKHLKDAQGRGEMDVCACTGSLLHFALSTNHLLSLFTGDNCNTQLKTTCDFIIKEKTPAPPKSSTSTTTSTTTMTSTTAQSGQTTTTTTMTTMTTSGTASTGKLLLFAGLFVVVFACI